MWGPLGDPVVVVVPVPVYRYPSTMYYLVGNAADKKTALCLCRTCA